ncbi:DUF6510 family protein [Microbacterium rhizosphaerae]|jgi:hypothetical protein|uniref:DUF6510 family protein n=1 Tax=Microbacterium rhizosphaerae TaxID=1678237 RepID=A0ABZ0SGW9_9MICO|nr:DUF6510 family protein [Microbacterium rhizosphaerae]WPR88088.1 DUF6510 family protein [Microbacterium rhizosphaerae]
MSEHDEQSVVDGNAVAGLLSEVFTGDATMFVGTCRRCDAVAVFAEAVVEMDDDAAIVRCRSCTHTLFTVLRDDNSVRLIIGALGEVRPN